MLVDALHAAAVVVGANFRFGAKAAGDVATLTEAGRTSDFRVDGIELDGGPQVWSSTYVRTCLGGGDVEGAAEALGRPFSVVGRVARGEQRGRELGYPTANVPTQGLAVPADGVYAGWLTVLDESAALGQEPRATAMPASDQLAVQRTSAFCRRSGRTRAGPGPRRTEPWSASGPAPGTIGLVVTTVRATRGCGTRRRPSSRSDRPRRRT